MYFKGYKMTSYQDTFVFNSKNEMWGIRNFIFTNERVKIRC